MSRINFIGPVLPDYMLENNQSRIGGFTFELTGALDAMQALSDIPARILLAQKRAIGTLQRKMKTEAKRDISAEYNIPGGRILGTHSASGVLPKAGLQVKNVPDGIKIIGKSRGVNAIEFGAKWTRVRASGIVATLSGKNRTGIRFGGSIRGETRIGARWAVKRGKPPEAHPDTFIARGKNGATLVFARGAKGAVRNKYGHFPRLPIEGRYGPSVAQMLKHGRRPERLVDFAIRTLQAEQKRLLGGS